MPPTLPAFYMPYRWRCNPNVDAARRSTKAWSRRQGLLDAGIWEEDAFDRADFAGLAALTYPDASLRRLELNAHWFVTAFYFDDFFLETYKRSLDLAGGRAYVKRLEAFMPLVPAILPVPLDEVERTLADLWPRTVSSMSATMLPRFREHVIAYLHANVWELSNRAHDWVPDPIEYVEMRRETVAAEFGADLIEYGLDAEIPIRIYRSQAMGAAIRAFSDWAGLQNDICSYPKESELEDEVNNGVVIAMEFLTVDAQQGVELVNDVLTARLEQFEHVVETELVCACDDACLSESERDRVGVFIQGARDWIAGDHRWHLESGRYGWHDRADGDRDGAPAAAPPRRSRGLGMSAAHLDGAFGR